MTRFALLVLIASCFGMMAQSKCDLSIAGMVIDEHDGQPLHFAEVYVAGLDRGVVVDSTGHFILKNICPGKYQVIATHIGCEPVQKTLSILQNVTNLNFYLEHHQELLQEAEVVEESIRRSAQAKEMVDARQLQLGRSLSLNEITEALSGVSTLESGNSIVKPVIHGLYGNRVITTNNGIRQEDQQWGLEHGLNIDLYTAENIEVVKGAASVQYGPGALGGVLKIGPGGLPYGERFGGEAILSAQSNGRGGSGAIKVAQGIKENLAWRAQLSGKRLGDQQAPDYVLSNTGTAELNGSLEAGFKKDKLTTEIYLSHFSKEIALLRASSIGNLSDLDSAIGRGKPLYIRPFTYAINNPRQEIRHSLAKASAIYRYDAYTFWEAIYGYQQNSRQEFDFRRGVSDDTPANDLRLRTQTLDLKLNTRHRPQWTARYGASGLLQVNTNIPGTGIRPILPNYNRYQLGAFAFEEIDLNNWILELGLRYDYEYTLAQKFDRQNRLLRPEFRFHNWSAIAGATYRFNEHWQYSSSLALASRPPHVIELLSEGLHHGSATIEIGDSSLQPEKSLNWSNTLSLNYSKKIKVELTAYLNPIDNYIFLMPQPVPRLTIRGAFPVYHYRQANALLAGADLSASVFLSKKFSYQFSGSYLRGYNRSESEDLILMPPPRLLHNLVWEPGWQTEAFFKLSHEAVARQKHYPEGQDLAPPPKGYHLLHLAAGAPFLKKENRSLHLTFQVRNLLSTGYRSYLDRFRYYADRPGVNFVFNVNYKF